MRARRLVAGKFTGGVRELIVGAHEGAGVDADRRMKPIHVGGHDERRQPFAEAGGHVERAERTVPQQVDALQRAAKLGEQRVHLLPRLDATARDQRRHRRAMAPGDLVEDARVRRRRLVPPDERLEQLVGDAVKRRDDHDDRLARRASRTIAAAARTVAGVASDDPPNFRFSQAG